MSNYKEITIRLEKISEYLKVLKFLKNKCSLEDFKNDPVLKGALERYFQLSAEASIDIGEIVISEKKLRTPLSHREVFDILGSEKIISIALAESFSEIAGFRNILVHDYVEIDLDRMYEYLQNNLNDFDKFIKAIARFLKKEYK